ncbi:MAG: cation diffusion facilitator family transporter [Gemmatimonadota bacterium]|nr:cation diffusion facilitator family transporter [Gemmatimonadota bacterium]
MTSYRTASRSRQRTPLGAPSDVRRHHPPGHDHPDHHHGHSHGGAGGAMAPARRAFDHGAHIHHRDGDHGDASGALRAALVLTSLFLVAEVVGGLVSNSLALLADAGHMLTDVGALAFSLFVAWLSRQPATPRRTYGYLRFEILAALLNGATLLAVSAAIIWEAIGRLRHPPEVETGVMLVVASGGLVVNLIAARMLHGSANHSLNVRGAYLHVLSDLLGSVAAVVAALLIRYLGWALADPITSILMTILIVRGSWSLVRESVDILLESTPAHINVDEVRGALEAVPDVESVHDLHVWTLTSGIVALSAHAMVRESAHHQRALEAMTAAAARFGINHTTIQLENRELTDCAPEGAVAVLPRA